MTQEKMTVHKALAELKIIDDRIEKAINGPAFVLTKKHNANAINGIPVAQLEENMRSMYQRAVDLIERRNAIKRAVVLSNARTTLTVAGKVYTVAEAIDMKQHGMDGLRALLATLQRQYSLATQSAARDNANLETRAEQYIISLYGNTDLAKAGEEAKSAREAFVAAQTVEIVDPLSVGTEKLHELEDRIATFMADVDAALSVSNAVTEIEVVY